MQSPRRRKLADPDVTFDGAGLREIGPLLSARNDCRWERLIHARPAHGACRQESSIMTNDPDPFEQGQRAARKNIPAEANPYQDGSEQHALWATGHEKSASEMEAAQSEGT
jgi:hypothetical protein